MKFGVALLYSLAFSTYKKEKYFQANTRFERLHDFDESALGALHTSSIHAAYAHAPSTCALLKCLLVCQPHAKTRLRQIHRKKETLSVKRETNTSTYATPHHHRHSPSNKHPLRRTRLHIHTDTRNLSLIVTHPHTHTHAHAVVVDGFAWHRGTNCIRTHGRVGVPLRMWPRVNIRISERAWNIQRVRKYARAFSIYPHAMRLFVRNKQLTCRIEA